MKSIITHDRLGAGLTALVGLLGVSAALSQGLPAPTSWAVFTPTAAPRAGLRIPAQAIAIQPVLVDQEALALAGVGTRLALDLLPGARFTGLVTRATHRGADALTVAGRLEGFQDSSFILVTEQEATVGILDTGVDNRRFRLGYQADGVHLISQIDPALFAPCAIDGPAGPRSGPVVASQTSTSAAGAAATTAGEQGFGVPADGADGSEACTAPTTVFDVIVAYTNVARAAAGGTSAIQAECTLAIETTNAAYDNSNISARMRMLYRGEVTYNESGTFTEHRDRLANTSDGIMDIVHTCRDTYEADVVACLVDDGAYCGIAYCTPSGAAEGFCIVNWGCASGNFSFPHEVGHLQGCAHDRANAGSGCNEYSYSYGWRFYGDSGTQWRTVMAYAPGTRVNYFSNPNIDYDGTPTGKPLGDPNESHNALTVNNTRGSVSLWRYTGFDVWVDFSYGGLFEFGLFDFPFDTLAEGVNAIPNYTSGATEYPNLYIKTGTTNVTNYTISDTMTIRACGGSVTIN